MHLLVDPRVRGRLPRSQALREPEGDLLGSTLGAIAAMADVASNIDGKVTANRANGAVRRLCRAEEAAAACDDILALPNHAHN